MNCGYGCYRLLCFTPTTITAVIRTIQDIFVDCMEGRLRIETDTTPTYAHAYHCPCMAGCPFDFPRQRFRLPAAKTKYPNLRNSRTTTREKANDSKGGLFIQMEELASLRVKPQLLGAPAPAHPMERDISCWDKVITTRSASRVCRCQARFHQHCCLEYHCGAILPLAQWPCFSRFASFYLLHVVSICVGTIQSRANVPLELTRHRLLLQVQIRLPITMQHIYIHAAALGAHCLISNQNMHTRWVHSSFDSMSCFAACDNLDDA